MQKPIVFISHIGEEKEVALALKKLVESAFIGMMDVFVSSDPSSIKLGQKWLDNITEALERCAVEIIIASPASVRRPWVNFEAGAGWIRKVPVIPLCHSGMVPSKLPAPLGTLQAATATNESELKLILPVLADALGSGLPDIDFTEFIETVREFEKTSRDSAALRAKTPIADTDGLAQHELATLLTIAETSYAPDEPVAIGTVRKDMENSGFRSIAVGLALKTLERKDLVVLSVETDDNGYNREEYRAVKVSDQGWAWLQENQDKLCLTIPPEPGPRPEPVAVAAPDDEIPF